MDELSERDFIKQSEGSTCVCVFWPFFVFPTPPHTSRGDRSDSSALSVRLHIESNRYLLTCKSRFERPQRKPELGQLDLFKELLLKHQAEDQYQL